MTALQAIRVANCGAALRTNIKNAFGVTFVTFLISGKAASRRRQRPFAADIGLLARHQLNAAGS
jgi:hypothetical protein